LDDVQHANPDNQNTGMFRDEDTGKKKRNWPEEI